MKPHKITLFAILHLLSFPSLLATEMDNQSIATADYKVQLKKITALEKTKPAQWRVTWTGNTSKTATISWSTAVAGKKHQVHIGIEPHGQGIQNYENSIECQRSGVYTINAKEAKDTNPAFYHHCRLTDLKPGTKYYFVLDSDGELSRQFYFITSSESGDFKLIAGGDSRSGHIDRVRMNLRIAKIFVENPSVSAFCHGGDFINRGRNWREWRLWLSHNELTTLSDGRVLPIIPTKGNHDGGPLFFEVFDLVSTSEKNRSYWHTTQLTKDVNIVTLDTNFSANGPQNEWLEQQLKMLRPQSKYLLTNYHRPLYPAVKKPTSHASVFIPTFEKYDVDLALESDGHCIKRTAPIRDGKIDPTGVVYIGEGGLGVGQRQPHRDHWYLTGGHVGMGHHVYLLDFSSDYLKGATIMIDGKVTDSFELKPRK